MGWMFQTFAKQKSDLDESLVLLFDNYHRMYELFLP
jgi:hypothetical protein